MLHSKKLWNLIGIILGISILIFGLVLSGKEPYRYSSANTDYATFGGDFYTYEYHATCAAAQNAAATASFLEDLVDFLMLALSGGTIAAGALITVIFGKKFFTETESSSKNIQPSEATVAPSPKTSSEILSVASSETSPETPSENTPETPESDPE